MLIPDQENQCLVAHTFSLTDVLYSQKEPQILTVFKNDLQSALAQLQTPLPANPEKTAIRLIKNPKEALDYLEMVEKAGKPFAFDYETTGLKPYLPQHRIISLGLSCCSGEGVAFLLYPETESAFARILANPAIKKIAANLKFEHQWSAVKLGVEVQGWAWDTMLSSHILDYRTHIHSLKRQAFIQLGKKRWDRTVEKWLHAVDDSPNALNRIQNIHVDDLLFYNAMDAALEYRLACRQRVLIQ
jgi:DNA polymerase I-like protein with 3'-5' exonuclease and polymerase domains